MEEGKVVFFQKIEPVDSSLAVCAILLGHLLWLGLLCILGHRWHDLTQFLDLLFLSLLQGCQRLLYKLLVDAPASLFSHSSRLHLEGQVLEELVHRLFVVLVDHLETLDEVFPEEPVDLHILFTTMLILLVGQTFPVSDLRLRHPEVFPEGLKPVELTLGVHDPRHRQRVVQLGLDTDAKDFLQDKNIKAADVMPN